MNSFTFLSPTKLVFGQNTEALSGENVKAAGGTCALIHYGSERVKKSGLLDRVEKSLAGAGVRFVELGGVVPNPRLSLVHEGVALCRREKVDFILAVGGGSVIDSAKAIALGVPYRDDVWNFYLEKDGRPLDSPKAALPIGVVLTIPATGSELSNSSVITDEPNSMKRFCDEDLIRPVFSIENPELTMTLPPYQTACGVVDIMSHSMERYFAPQEEFGTHEFTDRLCEAVFFTCMECGKKLIKDPHDYDARANIMVASSFSHNGLTGLGRTTDWASHMIEHELSGEYDVAHGAGLAVITPAWMKYVYKDNLPLFAQWAVRVMGAKDHGKDLEKTARQGIALLEDFFRAIGMPVRLGEMENVPRVTEAAMWRMARRVRSGSADGHIGGLKPLFAADIVEIFKLAL